MEESKLCHLPFAVQFRVKLPHVIRRYVRHFKDLLSLGSQFLFRVHLMQDDV